MTDDSDPDILKEFLGKNVKVPYKDGDQLKIARGILKSIDRDFIKLEGEIGIIVINRRNVEKLSEQKP